MITLMIQLGCILLLFLLSAFFAGTETGIYRMSRLRLRIGVQQKKSAYRILKSTLKDGQGLILSVLLGNNLVNYLLTSLVTVMLYARLSDSHAAEIYATIILTPTLFLFGEIIPKVLYYHKANTLMPSLAWLIWFANRLFRLTGAVAVLKGISRGLSFLFSSLADTAKAVDVTQRHQVHQIIHETQEEGLLSDAQKEMMSRLMEISSTSIESVMLPLKNVQMLPLNTSNASLLEHLRTNSRPRQLVYDGKPNNIVGFIPTYEVLGRGEEFEDLKKYTVGLLEISRKVSVIQAINTLRNQNSTMALVTEKTKQQKKTVGIITMTDMIEALTGDTEPEIQNKL